MVAVGMAIAACVIGLDVVLARRGSSFRVPVLAVAVGIYLPFELAVPIAIGGVVSLLASRAQARRVLEAPESARVAREADRAAGERHGLLFSAGLITGEALLGILLAVPIVMSGRADVLAFWGTHKAAWPGVMLLLLVVIALYRVAARASAAQGRAG
jgi:uncharacterized oligopeptide transporter (OPT) family protein